MTETFTLDDAQPYFQEVFMRRALIHCLTNSVTKNFIANALLAVGAYPAMVEAWQEIPNFTRTADNLLINVGTLKDSDLRGITVAAQTARVSVRPWVLDPVAVGVGLSLRSDFARELFAARPRVIRGNAAEILFLNGDTADARGVDSMSTSEDAKEAAVSLARRQEALVVVSGEIDYISDGKRLLAVGGGDSRLTRVTGSGCALSALIAAFVLCEDALPATAAACALMKHAGERASVHRGMGSFAVAVMDGLTLPLQAPTQAKAR